MAPDDWLSFYKQKLPAKAIMTGKHKVRSFRAMKDRSSMLCDEGASRSEGMGLKSLHGELKILHDHRGGYIVSSLSWSNIVERCDLVTKHLKVIPASLAQQVLSKFFKTCKEEQRWEDVMMVLNPWQPSAPFSAKFPRFC